MFCVLAMTIFNPQRANGTHRAAGTSLRKQHRAIGTSFHKVSRKGNLVKKMAEIRGGIFCFYRVLRRNLAFYTTVANYFGFVCGF